MDELALSSICSLNYNQMKQVLTIAVLILTMSATNCFGQDRSELRHCRSKEYKYDFYVQLEDKNVHYKDTVFYTWFRAQKIHTTQGNSDGYLLNGPYKKYYHSGQLAEQGGYKNGLKNGEWKSWRAEGTLISIHNYSNGVLDGDYFLYNEEGKRTKSGRYKKGLDKEVLRQEKQRSKEEKGEPFWKKLFKKHPKRKIHSS